MIHPSNLSQPRRPLDRDRPLRVAFAIFQTGNRANGGVESITKVIEHSRRIEPTVITQLHTPVNDRWRRAGADVHVWPVPYKKGASLAGSTWPTRAARLTSLAQTNLRTRRLLRDARIELLHVNDSAAMYHTLPGGWMARAACVHNIRDTKLSTDVDGIWKWKALRHLIAEQIVLSDEMRDFWLRAFDIDPHHSSPPITPIYSIVDEETYFPADTDRRQSLRVKLKLPADQPVIAYIAAVNAKKAQLKFLERAAPLLRDRAPGATVYFVGDCRPEQNHYAQRCLQTVEQLDLGDTVKFVGYDPDVVAWYQAADLVVIASREEGLARCMIESMGCGTPVVSFDVCSAREILESSGAGVVASQGDYPGLVDAIETILTHQDTRDSMGRAAESAARSLFAPDTIALAYESLYERLLDRRQFPSR